MNRRATPDEQIADLMADCYADPLKHVMVSYPWGTDPSIQMVRLATEYQKRFNCEFGPDVWQCEFLDELGAEVRRRGFDGRIPVDPIRFSTVTGHGTGKSTLTGWLIKWIMDTRPFAKGSVTATTDEQLRTKTWAELGKWHSLSLTKHWFNYNSSRGSMTLSHSNPEWSGQWRCDAKTCREEKSEAFAGQHAPNSTSFYIFDESSGVANKIYEVREGGLDSGEPMVFDFGNGTRNSGAFYENCMGREKARYIVRSIDSRSVSITNKVKIAQDAEMWGEDSDRFRVRWRGLFPVLGNAQFISSEAVEKAMSIAAVRDHNAPLAIGVDVARFGDDESVLYPRIGKDARSFEPERYSGLNSIQGAARVIAMINRFRDLGYDQANVFVDSTGGYGGGWADQLRHLGYHVIEVQFGGRPTDNILYRFKSDEMWGNLRDAIDAGLALPDRNSQLGHDMFDQLTQREYGHTLKGQLHLETKADMKARGVMSPDIIDALALTYAQQLPPRNVTNAPARPNATNDNSYEPHSEEAFSW
jgi:hypothetical protein